MRVRLRQQLLVALVVPAATTLMVVAFFAEEVAQRALDQALGQRLCAIAQAAGTLVGPQLMVLEVGDDEMRVKKNALAKLASLSEATGVARIVIARLDSAALVDTKEDLKIGDPYTRARFDRHELSLVEQKTSVASVLFEGPDRRPYKTGYAPLLDDDGKVVAFVGVEAPATYDEALSAMRHSLLSVAAVGLLLLGLGAVWIARRVSIPLTALAHAAERIGQGELSTQVPTEGPLEAAILGDTMQKMAANLRARDEEMQLMLAGIAHEVRNPLGGIELFGGLLREDLEPQDPRRKHVDKILRELGVLAKVVNDFLDFVRKHHGEPRPTGIKDLFEEVVSVAGKDAADRGVAVSFAAPEGLEARLDPDTMKRALLNLLRNGIQAAPATSGVVELGASIEGEELVLTVADNGPGVPPEKREEIWRPFFTTKQKGTGLGLALVKKTVVQHQGQISALDREGGGARFVIRLPLGLAGDGAKDGERTGDR